MSNTTNTPPTIRWQLLSTVSAFALLASTYAAGAAGNDADRPLIWIELGGQMENVSGLGDAFAPAFLAANPTSSVLLSPTPLQAQKPPSFSFGEEGKISFQPEDSDWVFSAGLRIGRSGNFRHLHHQTYAVHYPKYKYGVPHGEMITKENFADTQAHHKESHTVLDFSAGKDVGLGMFGGNNSSILSFGVRFAQFSSKSALDLRARPDLHIGFFTAPAPASWFRLLHEYFNTYHATGHASRSFRGVGPSLSWTGSTPFVGNQQEGELTLDLGVNASVLFGKQKTRVRHQESAFYENTKYSSNYTQVYKHPSGGHSNVRSITVPNVGGTVGLSWRVEDFKVSLGYRADFFFGAIDGGIDARKNETLAFKGPFASISVGLGD